MSAKIPLAMLVAWLASACGSPSSDPPVSPSTEAEFGPQWLRLIDAARAEGELVIILSASRSRDHRPVFDAFTHKFGVKVIAGSGSSEANVQRVLAERARGRFTADVTLIGTSGNERLGQSGALVPLEPQFIHPQVRDRSHGWIHDHQIWLGTRDGYIAAYKVYVRENITDIYYNTDKVTAEEIDGIRSWQDFLDPKWKGRIVAVMDPGGQTNTAHIRTPWVVLGRQWFDPFVRDQQPTLLPDTSQRELADGMARGKYHLSLFAMSAAERDMDRMATQGLPVRKLTRTLTEGTSLTIGGGLAILERAPHPNAAQLFVNWYLSRDGQNTYQTLIDSENPSPSLRTDVDQGRVSDYAWGVVRTLRNDTAIETDPEVAYADNAASVAFIKEVCADVGCYGLK